MKKVLALALIVTGSVHAQDTWTDIRAGQRAGAYLQDSRGIVVRSGTGMCWRGGTWTPADALPGCDGALAPPVVNPIAPPLAVEPPAPAPPVPVATARGCDFSYTISGNDAFAFGGSSLGPEARRRLDRELIPRLAECATISSVLITGHTDRLGAASANRKLSERRAEAVASYLKAAGLNAPVEIQGLGSDIQLESCADSMPRRVLLNCLAPNRRVAIEIKGIAK